MVSETAVFGKYGACPGPFDPYTRACDPPRGGASIYASPLWGGGAGPRDPGSLEVEALRRRFLSRVVRPPERGPYARVLEVVR